MKYWEKIEDDKVRSVWRCPLCTDEVNIEPSWYQYNGTPMCVDCDEDMYYLKTETNRG